MRDYDRQSHASTGLDHTHAIKEVSPSLVSSITKRAILTRVGLIFGLCQRNLAKTRLRLAMEL